MTSKNLRSLFVSIRVFEAAGRLLSFTRAAEELEISPGAVSQHIHALEAYAGQRLFRRAKYGVELTAPGEAALVHARSAMYEVSRTMVTMQMALPAE